MTRKTLAEIVWFWGTSHTSVSGVGTTTSRNRVQDNAPRKRPQKKASKPIISIKMKNFVEIYYQPLILSTTTCHYFRDADRTKKQQDRLLRNRTLTTRNRDCNIAMTNRTVQAKINNRTRVLATNRLPIIRPNFDRLPAFVRPMIEKTISNSISVT